MPGLPAVTPALALSLAWLFVTPFQRPWYDVMAIGLLAVYSASWLDWVVLIRLLAGATVYAQAVQSPSEPHWLYDLGQFNGTWPRHPGGCPNCCPQADRKFSTSASCG